MTSEVARRSPKAFSPFSCVGFETRCDHHGLVYVHSCVLESLFVVSTCAPMFLSAPLESFGFFFLRYHLPPL